MPISSDVVVLLKFVVPETSFSTLSLDYFVERYTFNIDAQHT
ncbi:MAG TPA: hypothetical protein VFS61_03315 [Anaerolineales bacterium]|nr:hypothetical protein [Anaerolineales bacterium]